MKLLHLPAEGAPTFVKSPAVKIRFARKREKKIRKAVDITQDIPVNPVFGIEKP